MDQCMFCSIRNLLRCCSLQQVIKSASRQLNQSSNWSVNHTSLVATSLFLKESPPHPKSLNKPKTHSQQPCRGRGWWYRRVGSERAQFACKHEGFRSTINVSSLELIVVNPPCTILSQMCGHSHPLIYPNENSSSALWFMCYSLIPSLFSFCCCPHRPWEIYEP